MLRLSLSAAMAFAIILAASACGSSQPKAGSPTLSSSRLILGGAVRCTATLKTPVHVGDDLGIEFAFHNVSQRPVNVNLGPYGGYWVTVRSPDGTTYDTRVPFENISTPPPRPTPIAPGATMTETLRDLRVRWQGLLHVTPGCGLSALRPVRVAVASPGLPASETAAASEVVAAAGHLLDHCRPRTSGVSVVGRIDAPSGDAPPLEARCSIDLHRERGFYRAQVLVVTPPDLPGVRVEPPYEALTAPYLKNSNTQVLGWEFVVTRQDATSVASADRETTRPGRGGAPDWRWTSSGPKPGGSGECGGSGGGFGVDGPIVTFVSVCR